MSNSPSVFISYRRESSVDLAQRIRDDLEKHKLNVFLDLERLSGGERWKVRLQRELVNCDFLLVILAPQTLESEWVRYEIKTALDQNKVIVPITHHGFTFSEGAVPQEIAGLADFNAIPFVDRYQKASLDEIREALGITANSDSQSSLTPDLAKTSPSPPSLQLIIAIIGLVGVISAALIGILPKLLELSSPSPTALPTQLVLVASSTLLPPTATETPLTPTDEPSLTPLPLSETPSPTDAPTPIPPTPLPAVSISVPTVVLPNTTILVTAWQNAHCIFTPNDGNIPFGFDTSTGNIQYSVKHKAGTIVSIVCEDALGRHDQNQFTVSVAAIPIVTWTSTVTDTALPPTATFTLVPTLVSLSATTNSVVNVYIATITLDPGVNLNLRREPDANSEVIVPIPAGNQVIVKSRTENGNWLNVIYKDQNGWIAAKTDAATFVDITFNGKSVQIGDIPVTGEPLVTERSITTVPPTLAKAYPCEANIRNPDNTATVFSAIHSEPSKSSAPQASSRVGDTVILQRETSSNGSEKWYLVYDRSNRRLGWILETYVSLSASCPS